MSENQECNLACKMLISAEASLKRHFALFIHITLKRPGAAKQEGGCCSSKAPASWKQRHCTDGKIWETAFFKVIIKLSIMHYKLTIIKLLIIYKLWAIVLLLMYLA